MKKIVIKHFVFVALISSFTMACTKEKTILPERELSESVEAITNKYNEILRKPSQGWILSYKPENFSDTVYINLKFKPDLKVDLLAGVRDYHTWLMGSTYKYEGQFRPYMLFDENSVLGYLANKYNGSCKFKIKHIESGNYFELVRADGYDEKVFKLEQASSHKLELLNDEVKRITNLIAYEKEQERLSEEVKLKVRNFAEIQSDLYFYNIKTTGFSASINHLDTAAREISLTYKETATSAPKTIVTNFSYYPQGIKLNPSISYAGILVDSIQLGTLSASSLEITKGGNTGSGKMGYMNEAPYAYTLSTDRALSLADYFRTIYTSYIQSTDVFSPKARIISEDLRNYIENNTDYQTSTRYIYYVYSPLASPANTFIIGANTGTGAIGNFRYDAKILDGSNNKIILNELTKQVLPTVTSGPNLLAQASNFLNAVSPSAGVTLVPFDTGAGYRLRMVSTSDSSIWVEYKWPNASYWNLIFN